MTRSHLVAGLDALSVAGLIAAQPAFAQTNEARLEQLLRELQTQLKFESEDENFKAWIHGRLLADCANYEEDKSKLDDDTEFHTAQFSLNGTLYRDWVFKAQVDVARETPNVKDLYLRYNFKPHMITVGQFKQPLGLERLTSWRFIAFMERALPSAFAVPRLIGLGYQTHGPNWSFALAGGGSDVSSKMSHQGDEGYSVTSRVHFAPLSEKTENVHLGAALSYRQLNDDTFRFRQRPESHVTSVRFVDTGNIASASDLFLYILEAATVWGPFSLQGEYTNATVEREAGLSGLDFYGWYGYVSFFLTPGDHRSYDPKKGAFGRVKPKRPFSEGGEDTAPWNSAFGIVASC